MAELGGADEIAKLADLKERGLLTDKEFEQRRPVSTATPSAGPLRGYSESLRWWSWRSSWWQSFCRARARTSQ